MLWSYILTRFLDVIRRSFRQKRFEAKSSMLEGRPQVEGQGKFKCAFLAWRIDLAGRVAVVLKPGKPPRLCLVGIDGFGLVAAPARMGDVIDAAPERPAVPGVDQIKSQWRMHRNGRVQPRGRLPRLETDGGDRFARAAGFGHRHPPAVAGDDVTAFDKAGRLDLQPLDRRIDVAHGAARRALFAENMPWLERLTHFERNAAMVDPAEHGKPEFELRCVPFR